MTLEEALRRNPHLKIYIDNVKKREGRVPQFITSLSRDLKELTHPNLIYPVGDPIFIHISSDKEGNKRYTAVEPELKDDEKDDFEEITNKMLEYAPEERVPSSDEEMERLIEKLFKKATGTGILKGGTFFSGSRVTISENQADKFLYLLKRDIIGTGPLEPLIRDAYIEDIHVIGARNTHVVHKIFGMLETNINFGDDIALVEYLKNMGERIGRPVSEASPIVDGSLPDGSRINIIFSTDVSKKGPSFTIRKFSEVPLSITQLVAWGTLSSEEAAYLWLCLEYGMSIFVCGETASGKTTTLNSILPFIKPDSKIYTAEDTAEVLPPHNVWQQLLTRERGGEAGRVDLFDLLRAALRSRPNYIIVGEIRGKEGNIAFQAMQTGHPVLATFHAASVKKMIQRFTGDPINVPITFIDNLNVALIQQAVYRKGKFLRRCTSVEEIEGYYDEIGGVVTRTVFQWDPVTDRHVFRGLNNSYILENKIAQTAGYEDPREIYNELELRAKIIEEMIARNILGYFEVNDIIRAFYKRGLEGLPFTI